MEKKIDEIFLTRKINSIVESRLISIEENLARVEEQMAEAIKDKDVELAYCYYQNMRAFNKRMEEVKSFKDYLLKDKKE